MTIATEQPPVTAGPATLQEDAAAVLGRVRSVFGELLASLSGIRRPADLQRELDIDYKMSWRACRIAAATDPLTVGVHVPGPSSMKRFLKKARQRGVPIGLIEATQQAGHDFEGLVRRHAGDRKSFDSMMSALTGDWAEQIDLEQKRTAFRAASHLYGLQVGTGMTCRIINGNKDENRFDICLLQGHMGLRRSRANAPLMLSRHVCSSDYGAIDSSFVREPLDPKGSGDHGVSLLRKFCSHPTPRIRISELSTGEVQADLVGREVGMAAEVTCVLGHVSRNLLSPYSDDTLPRLRNNQVVRVPTEVLVHDVLMPNDLFGEVPVRLFVFTEQSMLDLNPGHEGPGLLPVAESVMHLGRGPAVIHTPDVPRYGELLEYAFDRLGWDAEKFEVYRCRIEYPVMHSVASIQFYLPEKPE